MISAFLLGFTAGLIGGTLIAAFIDEIIDWAKRTMAIISSWIKRAQVWIQRIPGGIKQFLYYVKNGDYMVQETTRPATPAEIKRIKDNMGEREWEEFTGDEGTHIANVERDV